MEDVGLLKKFDFFRNLTTFEIVKMNMITERVAFKKGEEIVKEGSPCDSIFIVKEGSVKVIKGGKQIVTLGKGNPLGEISFVDKGKRSATLVADKSSVLIKIRVDKLAALLEKEKEIAYKVYRALAVALSRRLRNTTDALLFLPD